MDIKLLNGHFSSQQIQNSGTLRDRQCRPNCNFGVYYFENPHIGLNNTLEATIQSNEGYGS